jgi:hypothetical protein
MFCQQGCQTSDREKYEQKIIVGSGQIRTVDQDRHEVQLINFSGILNHRLSLVSTDFGTSKDFLGTSEVSVLTKDSLLIQLSTES